MEKGTFYLISGLSGAGKTTVGTLFYQNLRVRKSSVVFIDGDKLRAVMELCVRGVYSQIPPNYLIWRVKTMPHRSERRWQPCGCSRRFFFSTAYPNIPYQFYGDIGALCRIFFALHLGKRRKWRTPMIC